MYRYDKKRIRIKKVFMSIILFISISVGSIASYEIYMTNEQIKQAKQRLPEVQRVSQEVEIVEENEQNISDIINETLQTVVGISKIKNSGTSIFGADSATQLGLGTGVIISEDGYIVTNEHVSGAKYSSCYVTLENGDVYNGNVIWSDSDLDVAILNFKYTINNFIIIQ